MEHGTRRWLAAAAPLIAIACAGERYALVGFPLGPTSSARESSEKLQGDPRDRGRPQPRRGHRLGPRRRRPRVAPPARRLRGARRRRDRDEDRTLAIQLSGAPPAAVPLSADHIPTYRRMLDRAGRRGRSRAGARVARPRAPQPRGVEGVGPLFRAVRERPLGWHSHDPEVAVRYHLYESLQHDEGAIPRGARAARRSLGFGDRARRREGPLDRAARRDDRRRHRSLFRRALSPSPRPPRRRRFRVRAPRFGARRSLGTQSQGNGTPRERRDLRPPPLPKDPVREFAPGAPIPNPSRPFAVGTGSARTRSSRASGANTRRGAPLPERMASFRKSGPEMRAAANAIRAFVRNYAWFEEALAPIADRIDRIADEADDPTIRKGGEVADEALRRIRDLQMVIGKFLADDPSPAPVFLDEPNPKNRDFSFIVGADLQYDTDASCLQQFLAIIDETRIPGGITKDPNAIFAAAAREARGRSSSSSSATSATARVSAAPHGGARRLARALLPTSPYAEHSTTPHKGEFPELREMIRKSRHPIFVVPGNHDGFVNYGGILNQLTLFTGRILQWIPLIGFLGDPLVNVSDDLPVLVKIWRISPPFYDGLIDWSLELGPRNLAFHYRGSAFVAVNSFDLEQFARDQVGALASNWGRRPGHDARVGRGVAPAFLATGSRGARAAPAEGTSFVFMHHDPRAGIASKNGYVEKDFGHYNDVTSPMTEITFGYLGTSSALYTNLWIPILSPIATGAIRSWTYGENFQERWMRSTGVGHRLLQREGADRHHQSQPGGLRRRSTASRTPRFRARAFPPILRTRRRPRGVGVGPSQRQRRVPRAAERRRLVGARLRAGWILLPPAIAQRPRLGERDAFRRRAPGEGGAARRPRRRVLGGEHPRILARDRPSGRAGAASRPAADVRWIPIPR